MDDQNTFESVGDAAERVVKRLVVRHAPGIYFGMPEYEYHADPALGSTDVKRLAYSPADYWFSSPLNPHREPDDPTPAQIFGTAIHKLILEGEQAFEGRYAPTKFNGATKAGKQERDDIRAAGKIALKQDDFDRIKISGAVIRANPHLGEAFHGGLPEVSIFWESAGIRRKCRIDYLKRRASVDLKSIRNSRNVGFSEACRRAISEFRYDVQAAHYRDGRAAMAALYRAGAVYGDVDAAWLDGVVTSQDAAWVFVFYQAEGAPLSWGTVLSPANPIFDVARAVIDRAETNYRNCVEAFGEDTPWIEPEPLAELDISEMPAWYGRT